MKKVFCLILLLIIPATAFCADIERKTLNKKDGSKEVVYSVRGKEIARQLLDKNKNIVKASGRIPDGKVRGYHPNGQVSVEMYYKNNKPEGPRKAYYINGQLMSEARWKDGYIEGVTRKYYLTGQISKEENLRKGQLHGIKKTYYPNGQLQSESPWKNGQLEGTSKTYYENGKLMLEKNIGEVKLWERVRFIFKTGIQRSFVFIKMVI